MGDKVGTAGQGGGGDPQRQQGGVNIGEERKRRGEEVNRGKTHFWRDQAEFGVYLYE